jgi:hypothetical protein
MQLHTLGACYSLPPKRKASSADDCTRDSAVLNDRRAECQHVQLTSNCPIWLMAAADTIHHPSQLPPTCACQLAHALSISCSTLLPAHETALKGLRCHPAALQLTIWATRVK